MSDAKQDPVLLARLQEHLKKPRREHRERRHVVWVRFEGLDLLATTKRLVAPTAHRLALCNLLQEEYRKSQKLVIAKPSELQLLSHSYSLLPAAPDSTSPDLCPLCSLCCVLAQALLITGGSS